MNTNEGQDGLTEILQDLRHSAKVDDYEPQQIAFIESIADRIARHLSSKQAARPGNATMYDPNDVAFPKGFMPVEAQADHSERHLKMVKADAVKMPEYIYGRECAANEKVIPLHAAESYATAHTAEAVRELVEGLKQARETINLLWLSHHANRSDAAIEACDALLAKYAPSQEGNA